MELQINITTLNLYFGVFIGYIALFWGVFKTLKLINYS
jgi:hypothetical protein